MKKKLAFELPRKKRSLTPQDGNWDIAVKEGLVVVAVVVAMVVVDGEVEVIGAEEVIVVGVVDGTVLEAVEVEEAKADARVPSNAVAKTMVPFTPAGVWITVANAVAS